MNMAAQILKSHHTMLRLLMIDNQQNHFNQICTLIEKYTKPVNGKLLDDLNNFEKMLNLQWDVIVFHAAFDFDYLKAIALVKATQRKIPMLLLSEMAPHSKEGLKAFDAGIDDIIHPHHLDLIKIRICQAFRFSRLMRREQQLSLEVDQLQQQTQNLVEHNEHPSAIIQEGVYLDINQSYLKLFKFDNPTQLIGLPVLDTLKPKNLDEFKTIFKRLSRGDLSKSLLKIESLNPHLKDHSLNLQFSATVFDDEPALRMVITNQPVLEQLHHTNTDLHHFVNLHDIYDLIQVKYAQNPHMGLILTTIDEIPHEILHLNWHSTRDYFEQLHQIIKQTISDEINAISETVFISFHDAHNQSQLNQYIDQLNQQFPKSLAIAQTLYPISVSSHGMYIQKMPTFDELDQLMERTLTLNNSLEAMQRVRTPSTTEAAHPAVNLPHPDTVPVASMPSLSLGEKLDYHPDLIVSAHPQSVQQKSSLIELMRQIENNQIILNFQQLYDKEQIDNDIFEVTAAFEFQDQWIELNHFQDLKADQALTLKLDRWVLVEASKRLHQYLAVMPKARVIVNLHAASLLDQGIFSLLIKLTNLINSKYNRPLILQFNEHDILKNFDIAQSFFSTAYDHNIGIFISEFGQSAQSHQILQHLTFKAVKLSQQYSKKLASDDGIIELQEKIADFRAICPELQCMLGDLDQELDFVNAWNVDARYLQGDYFQTSQPEIINSQGA